ncbi:MAG: ABC transporter substrate-binding protein [Candidatus Pacebacteria bacterium]|nr:ABC transporter substrate-binding protein [Candidatus Paceibacterota bacterium]
MPQKLPKKIPTFSPKTLFQKIGSLHPKKRSLFIFFLCLFLASCFLLLIDFYFKNTSIVPAPGGILREGVVGQPRFINPIYADTNDVDKDLVNLIFSGLMKYGKDGKIEEDIASGYEIQEGGRIYIVNLKKNVFFHDGEKLDADDVIFTIRTIQNPDFKSPLLAKWLGVEIEKISDYQIKFILKNPYPSFLENLTLKILPAHIWQDISFQNFPLSPYNFKPIGSGPYKFKSLVKNPDGSIKSIVLLRNQNYYQKKPYINQIELFFFKDERDLLAAARSGLIDSFSPLSFKNLAFDPFYKKYSFTLPRYFALFLNSEKNEFFANKNIKKALDLIIDREKIVKDVLDNNGTLVLSPFLPNVFHFSSPKNEAPNPEEAKTLLEKEGFEKRENKWVKIEKAKKMHFTKTLMYGSKGKEVENLQKCLAKFEDIYPEGKITGYFGKKTKEAVIRFQEKYREEILKPAGLKKGNGRVGPKTREKLNEVCIIEPENISPFKITITTGNNPLLVSLAEKIKEQLNFFGIETEIKIYEISKIKQEIIKERDYEALLFGQVLGIIPDPFPFWHSTQRRYPGLNLSNYKNKKLDKILEDLRETSEVEKRKELLEKAQEILLRDTPAIFICNPNYLYFVSEKVKGVEETLIPHPSERFLGIQNWYINTRRSFRKNK